jgi:heptosyltransferase-3
MRILCIQLARFGDILQTLPTLSAFKRQYPEAHVTLMVRKKFLAAAHVCAIADHVIEFDTQLFLSGYLDENCDVASCAKFALEKVSEFIQGHAGKFDKIINLSFSPMTSYLTQLLSGPSTVVHGYTRHPDGFLALPDDPSSYFYAQVGVGRWNRLHLIDLFSLVADTQLGSADVTLLAKNQNGQTNVFSTSDTVVVHVGASERHKSAPKMFWENYLVDLDSRLSVQQDLTTKVILVGSAGEFQVDDVRLKSMTRLDNQVGKTTFSQVTEILCAAKLIVGADSFAMQIATLANVPALNLSLPSVRFWETGPRSQGSIVLRFDSRAQMDSQLASEQTVAMLKGLSIDDKISTSVSKFSACEGAGVVFQSQGPDVDDLVWQFCESIYMNREFPVATDNRVLVAFSKIREIGMLALGEVERYAKGQSNVASQTILQQTDILLQQIGERIPEVRPVVQWFLTEKLRIGPGSLAQVTSQTTSIYEKLIAIAQLYDVQQYLTQNGDDQTRGLTWK